MRRKAKVLPEAWVGWSYTLNFTTRIWAVCHGVDKKYPSDPYVVMEWLETPKHKCWVDENVGTKFDTRKQAENCLRRMRRRGVFPPGVVEEVSTGEIYW
jgi:hypothetical protein